MLANWWSSLILSKLSLIFWLSLPLSWSALAIILSKVPYSVSNLAAVFAPTPGTPMMPSDASPIRVK